MCVCWRRQRASLTEVLQNIGSLSSREQIVVQADLDPPKIALADVFIQMH